MERDGEIREGEIVALDEKIDVVPLTHGTQEATEWIESEEFKDTLKLYRNTYDIIIIDTPPAGLFPDASLLGNMADHFIFITQLNKHRKAVLKAILNRLEQGQAQVLGIVANKVSKSKSRNLGAYRYADYRKYRNYYPEKG